MAKHNFDTLYNAWASGLLKKLSTASKTQMIETLPQEDFFKKGASLDFIDIAVGGLGKYTKTDGSNTPWSGFKQKQVKTIKYRIELDFDVSVEWNIDSVDFQENHNILTAENILRRHNTFHMIPKFDTYSFSKLIYKNAQSGEEYDTKVWKDWDGETGDYQGEDSKPTIVIEDDGTQDDKSGYTISDSAKLLTQIDKMILAFDNAEIPLEQLVLFLAPYHFHLLEALKAGHLRLSNEDSALNYVITKINGVQLVKVPESRLWSKVWTEDMIPLTTKKAGELFPTGTAKQKEGARKIGLLLFHIPVAFKAFSRNIVRVWDASENIRADSNVIQRRLHGITHLYPGMEQGVYAYLLKEIKT